MGFPSITSGFAGIQSIVNATHGNTYDNYSGAIMLFAQTSAPTGWTKETADNDTTLRVTTGSTSTGGTAGFSTVMTSSYLTPTGTLTGSSITIGTASLSYPQLPAHSHNAGTYFSVSVSANSPGTAFLQTWSSRPGSWPNSTLVAPNPNYTGSATGPWTHSHPSPGPGQLSFTGTSVDMSVKYVDVIVATKT